MPKVRKTVMKSLKKVIVALVVGVLIPTASLAASKSSQRKTRLPRAHARALSSTERKQAQRRLAEMGYGSGGTALIAFQKFEGRKATGALNRGEFDAIMAAAAPVPKDSGYRHVEVDLDRQILVLVGDEGNIEKIVPVSTGSNRKYKEKRMSGLAYTPRGRFRIYAKIAGWRRSPLGLLYYPSYFSDGLAIHGNPSVPDTPQSHGCIRVPMSAAIAISRQLPVGTILLIYDSQSFVSGKAWAEEDKQKQAGTNP
jgi:lipoprotein-anchoring transpeptidase ErfK/SrfK